MADTPNQSQSYVGVEISKTSLHGVCLDAKKEIAATKVERIDESRSTIDQTVDFIASLEKVFGNFDRLGMAVPGLVDQKAQKIVYSAQIKEHSGMGLAARIFEDSGKKARIENDANAAAYGEFRLGAGRGSDDMFYATLGDGIGGSIIIGGQIWRGGAGFAGEFGYFTINSDGMRLEDVASAVNIVRRTRSRFHQDSTSSLVEMDENTISIADIVTAAESEDDFARLMLQRTGTYVGTAIAAVINLLNIEKIVIGGEIMQAGEIVLTSIVERANELAFGPSFKSTSIVAGELGSDAAAAGAALLAHED